MDEKRRTAAFYRERARHYRAEAEEETNPERTRLFLLLAEAFDAEAETLEKRGGDRPRGVA